MSDFSDTRDEWTTRGPQAEASTSGAAHMSRAQELEMLMSRYQTEDAQAGAVLVERLSTKIFQYFLAHVRNRAHAEDLLQDFWLRIHNSRHTFRAGQPLLPWLYAIAHRTRIDDYRKQRRQRLEDPLDEAAAYAARVEEPPSNRPNIRRLLEALPASQREAIWMMKVGGLSLEDVARATGSTVGAVKQRVHRGYERLRRLLKERP